MLNIIKDSMIEVEASHDFADRQILSFFRLPVAEGGDTNADVLAGSKNDFLVTKLPEGSIANQNGKLFSWSITSLYDINRQLLFRDFCIELSEHKEIRVRTAASNLLKTPVWSVKAGLKLDFFDLVKKAVDYAINNSLVPLMEGSDLPKLICYSYPKIGIFCKNLQVDGEPIVVLDVGDWSCHPLRTDETPNHSEGTVCWTPYELVTPGTIGQFKDQWRKNTNSMPKLVAGNSLLKAIAVSRENIEEEKSINPELILQGQQTNVFCAVASAKMILKHHGFDKTQDEIAAAMQTANDGTTNENQVNGYRVLSSNNLIAQLDENASFTNGCDEIKGNRPFKSGVPAHARACGGFKKEFGERKFLYIYDPWPPNKGDVYYEDWSATLHTNFLYVRPRQFT